MSDCNCIGPTYIGHRLFAVVCAPFALADAFPPSQKLQQQRRLEEKAKAELLSLQRQKEHLHWGPGVAAEASNPGPQGELSDIQSIHFYLQHEKQKSEKKTEMQILNEINSRNGRSARQGHILK